MLTTAAVIGRSFSLPLLETLENDQADAALEAVEHAERARLVEPEPSGRELRYRFVHELIRQTLEGSLSLPRRQRLHARIVAAIEHLYADRIDSHAPALAYHLYQAGAAVDTEKTISWLTCAGEQSGAATAFEDALSHFENTRLLLSGERSSRMAELHAARATVLRSLGRMPDALKAFDQALGLFQATGNTQRFAEISLPVMEIYWWTERLDEAHEVCRRALEALGPRESPLRSLLLHATAGIAALSNNMPEALALLGQVEKSAAPPRMQTYLQFVCSQLETAYRLGADSARFSESTEDLSAGSWSVQGSR